MNISCSLDFELGWGTVETRDWESRANQGVYTELRHVLPQFLRLTNELEIPVTFACVGAMVETPRDHEFSHLPLEYQKHLNHFVDSAPETAIDARDLMEGILSSQNVIHEISSHSYSHLHAKHKDAGSQNLKIETEKSIQTIKKNWNTEPISLVFPRDQPFPAETFQNSSLRCIRVPPIFTVKNKIVKQLETPNAKGNTQAAFPDSISGSLFLNWGIKKNARPKKHLLSYKTHQILQNIRKEKTGDLHFWLHPFNLSHTPGLYEFLAQFFNKLAELRDKDKCHLITMSDHCQMILNRTT